MPRQRTPGFHRRTEEDCVDSHFKEKFMDMEPHGMLKDVDSQEFGLNSIRMNKEEFRRITTINLERTFLSKLDTYTPKLLEIFGTKGGAAGTKIRPMLDSLGQDVGEEDSAHHVLKILLISGNAAQEDHSPAHVSDVVEVKEVLDDCKTVVKACLLLMGFIYAMNLS